MSEAQPGRRRRSLAPAKASPNEPATAAAHAGPEPSLRDASATGPRRGSPEAQPAGFICPPCGRFVATDLDGVLWRGRTGSAPRFCSPACRQAGFRRRQAGVDEGLCLQREGGRNRSLDAGHKGERP